MFLCFSTNTYTTETPHVPGELIVKLKPNVNETKVAGYYTASFDASKLSSGIYIFKLVAGGFEDVKKMVVMK
jgi:hypothetical protein